mgnify:CR=1 FL=1
MAEAVPSPKSRASQDGPPSSGASPEPASASPFAAGFAAAGFGDIRLCRDAIGRRNQRGDVAREQAMPGLAGVDVVGVEKGLIEAVTLRVRARGYQEASRSFAEVPSFTGEYDLIVN